jgi:DNA polymerase-1
MKTSKPFRKESVREKLRASREQAFLSYDLATIKTDVPLSQDSLSCFEPSPPDAKKVKGLLERLEFQSFLKKFEMEERKEEPVSRQEEPQFSGEILHLLTSLENNPCAYLFSGEEIEIYCGGRTFRILEKDHEASFFEFLKGFFESKAIRKTGSDIKKDIVSLSGLGIFPRGLAFDVAVAAYLLDPSLKSYEEQALAERFWTGRRPGARRDLFFADGVFGTP